MAIVLSNDVEVVLQALFWPETLIIGPEEIALRVYPTVVQIIGISTLLAGATLADMHPRPIPGILGPADKGGLERDILYAAVAYAAYHNEAV